ncbi:MAG: hypothetical protein WD768_14205 [Phycisphaeraceae bacterium]
MMRGSLTAIVMLVGTSMLLAADGQPALTGVGGAAGIGQYPPDRWALASSTISNPTAKAVELLVNFRFDQTPNLEFATRVWVPAGCRRSVWLPIHTFWYEVDEGHPPRLALRQQLVDDRGTQTAILSEQDGLLIAARDRVITGMLTDSDESDDEAISTVLAARRAQDLSKRLAYLNDTNLPPFFSALQGLDALVISKQTPVIDAAQLEALRQWVLAGGRLWIMLDQVDDSFAQSLLGDAWTIQVIDKVYLTNVSFQSPGKTALTVRMSDDLNITLDGKPVVKLTRGEKNVAAGLDKLSKQIANRLKDKVESLDRRALIYITGGVDGNLAEDLIRAVRTATETDSIIDREHEKPVTCVRVLAPGFETMHSVAGWPVALQKAVGKGSVMVTTLGPRGWVEPVLVPATNPDGTVERDEKGHQHFAFGHFALRPLEDISIWLHQERAADPLPSRDFTNYLSEQIGYQIVGRGTVMIVLTLLCAAILLNGLWLAKRGRLEHLAIFAVAAAVVMSIAMIVIGSRARTAVPATLAEAQFVQVAPDQQYAIVSGMFTVYNPGTGSSAIEGENATLKGDAGGLVLPMNLQHLGLKRVQLLWTDVDKWEWRNVPLPSGANLQAATEHILPMHEPVSALVSFDAQGAVGVVHGGSLGRLDDMLIVTSSGAAVPRVEPYGAFHASQSDVLPPGQFASGAIDDARRRRLAILQSLLGSERETDSRVGTPTRAEVKVDALGAPIGAQRSRLPSTYPASPMLLAWADAIELGFERPAVTQTTGSALVAIPLSIVRPAAGTTVSIPSAFLPYRVGKTQFGITSPVFDERRRQWNDSPRPSAFALEFQIPTELGKLKLTEANFTLDISAPAFKVEVGVERDGKFEVTATKTGSDGLMQVALPADGAQPDAQGRVNVVLRVSSTGSTGDQLWRVRHVSLNIKGIVE